MTVLVPFVTHSKPPNKLTNTEYAHAVSMLMIQYA